MKGVDTGIAISVSWQNRMKLFFIFLLFLDAFHFFTTVSDAN